VKTRNQNDIEINIILLQDTQSVVVASNNQSNLEATEPEEHAEIINSLKSGKVHVEISQEDNEFTDEQWETHGDSTNPDYYFPPGYRIIDVFTPLYDGDEGIGAVNIKLSIHYLDEKLSLVYQHITTALILCMVLLASGLIIYLNTRLFNPLWKIANSLYQFGIGNLQAPLVNSKKADEIGVLTNEFNNMVVRIKQAEDQNKKYQHHLEELVDARTKEVLITQEVTIEAMGVLAETRDPETGGHIKRTRNYVKVLSEHLRSHPKFRDYFNDETIDLLYKSAPLHDIGKVGIPDNILLKPGKLTENEFEEMKKHTTYGYESILVAERKLGSNSFSRIAREIAHTHQEKWDGSGYPQGLAGNDIPVSGRLMAIADVYDALISRRVYKPHPSLTKKQSASFLKVKATISTPSWLMPFSNCRIPFVK